MNGTQNRLLDRRPTATLPYATPGPSLLRAHVRMLLPWWIWTSVALLVTFCVAAASEAMTDENFFARDGRNFPLAIAATPFLAALLGAVLAPIVHIAVLLYLRCYLFLRRLLKPPY